MRKFVVGDIHGCYVELMAKLNVIDFDFANDHLYALGDLVDRGPDSAAVVRLLNEPWFSSIKGNHEVLMCEAYDGNPVALATHLGNGGGWFATLGLSECEELVALVRDLPIALTVTTPSGRRIGLVHADMPGCDWQEFLDRLDTPQVQDYAMWTRERIGVAKRNGYLEHIRGVDHVYFGHTPVGEPVRCANISWIDTGCFATGRIHVEELL